MTGFKSGASTDDPFGDDATDDTVGVEAETEPEENSNSSEFSGNGLPWIYERDSITDGRKTVQLHLQESSIDRQREVRTSVEDVLGERVNLADLREAALLVGFNRIDDVADQLREWGYDFE